MTGAAVAWAQPELAALVARSCGGDRREVVLQVTRMADSRRRFAIQQRLQTLPGVVRIRLDPAAARIRILFDASRVGLVALLDACGAAGGHAEPLALEHLDDPRRVEADDALKRLAIAGICAMQTMMFAVVLYLGMFESVGLVTMELFRWLCLLSAAPVVGYSAWPFYRHCWQSLRAGRPGIDVPIALAIVLIFSGSLVSTLRGSGEVYFDSISMFVFVLLLGRYLELRARHRNGALGERVVDGAPLIAERLAAGNRTVWVPAATLQPGDLIRVAEGQSVPVDGTVAGDSVRIDAAILSGESRPLSVAVGGAVAAGSVVLDEQLVLCVARTVAESTVARLADLAWRARRSERQQSRPENVAAQRFVWRVLALACATVVFWLWQDPTRAFDAAVAVLVVACPCAFALAAPATLTRAMSLLAARGVLVVRPNDLETLARVDLVLFDKTGTLTESRHVPCAAQAAAADDRSLAGERLRPGARELIHDLRQQGIQSQILSGDVEDRVREVAERLRVDAWKAELTPDGKCLDVRHARAGGKCVLMVGDGSNDAAALAAADVSATVAGGSALALGHAGIVLLRGPADLALAIDVARRATMVLQQNRRWALAYNLVVVPFAAAGLVSPWLAAIGMSLSSIGVVLNALRVRASGSSASPPAAPRLRESTA